MNERKARRPARLQVCPTCGGEFTAYASQNRTYCSRPCRHEADRVARVPFKMRKGYRLIYVGRDHPMADGDGNAYEHRIVLSRHLGRVLSRDEHVHHKNGVKTDNRPENLELTTISEHMATHRRVEGWATNFDACITCGRTDSRHAARGRCSRCHNRWLRGRE